MRGANVKEVYQNLKLIVVKNQFLVPQRPFPPVPLYARFQKQMNQTIWNHDQSGTHKNLKNFHQILKQLIKNDHPDCVRIAKEYNQERSNYDEQKIAYDIKYVLPLRMKEISDPYPLFVKNSLKQMGSTFSQSIVEIGVRWRNLSQKEKDKIYKSFEKEREAITQRYAEFVREHQIPKICNPKPNQLFMKQYFQRNSITTIPKEMHEQYRNLSKEEKERLSKQCLLEKSRSQEKYDNFLKKWKISHEQLQHIRKICQEYENYKSAKKLSKKQLDDLNS